MKPDIHQNQNSADEFDIVEVIMRLARTIKRTNHEYHHKHNNHFHKSHHGHSGSHHSRGGLGDNRLLTVIMQNNRASSRELAEIIDVRPSSLTEMLNRLEAKKFIRRFRDEQDSRIIHVELTDEGISHMNEASDNNRRLHEQISGCLNNDEQKTFMAYCQRLMDTLKEGAED